MQAMDLKVPVSFAILILTAKLRALTLAGGFRFRFPVPKKLECHYYEKTKGAQGKCNNH